MCPTPWGKCTDHGSSSAGERRAPFAHPRPAATARQVGVYALAPPLSPIWIAGAHRGLFGPRDAAEPGYAPRRPLYFGHFQRTTGGVFHEEDRPFDPCRDIERGTVVAVALHDDDAVKWGRSFDIVKVLEKLPAANEDAPLRVQYYVSCARPRRRGSPPTQSEQFEGNWVLGSRESHGESAFGIVDASNTMCACWIDGPENRPSPIHADYRLRLL